METPNFLKSSAPVRCPSCGSEKVHLRSSPDPIDNFYHTPVRQVQRLFGAQLYHCFVCRMQFYDLAEPAPQETPVVAEPTPAPRVAAEPAAGEHTVIGETITIRGYVSGAENIALHGTIEGPVALPGHRLTIGVAGRMRGEVRAGEVAALGTVQGNLEAHSKVAVGAHATVIGNIRAASLSVAEGAYLRGKIETVPKTGPHAMKALKTSAS